MEAEYFSLSWRPVHNSLMNRSSRIQALDTLRGAAVLCGLLVSIWVFGGFSNNEQTKLLLHPSGGNYRLFATISLFFEGKMRALIALVFGAGMWLFMEKYQQRTEEPKAADLYIRRQMWLMVFGLVN